MKIVVIGGTGLIGSKLVKKLGEQRHEAVAVAPNTGVNTLTGAGLAEVLKTQRLSLMYPTLLPGRTQPC